MQTSIATANPCANPTDDPRSAAEARPASAVPLENDLLAVDGEPDEAPRGIAAMLMLAPALAATQGIRHPPARQP